MEKLNVGILIFENVEVLDFAGPFEVFSRTRLTPGTMSRRSEDSAPFNVYTVAETSQTVIATGGLQLIPSYNFNSSPKIDILVVPGGLGTRPRSAEVQASQCSGRWRHDLSWLSAVRVLWISPVPGSRRAPLPHRRGRREAMESVQRRALPQAGRWPRRHVVSIW